MGAEGRAVSSPVLLSWLAQARDPTYTERGEQRNGPTWTLLCDPESSWRGQIRDAVIFHHERDTAIARKTEAHVRATDSSIRFHLRAWTGEDPTNHRDIFRFLEAEVEEVRRQFLGRKLVIHLSPGTPAMHAVWLLMAESGFIDEPLSVVQSVPREFRKGGRAVVEANVGIDTFYKRYLASQPAQVASPVDRFRWSIERFRSPAMVAVREAARRYARLNAPVLILGERGTGKTQLASWIRFQSPFRLPERDESWPTIACGQYTPEMMRAELFGYKKGAFTGAITTRQGLLVTAHKDTLFLDEVGDVSPEVQRLLIRAVEEKTFLPLGDDKPRTSDFRLLSATNLAPDALRKRLSADFLDRVSYLTLRLPPLREMREDLPWLWGEVLSAAAGSARVPRGAPLPAEDEARLLRALATHGLPGNLRDLFRAAYALLAEGAHPGRAVEAALAALHDPLGDPTVPLPAAAPTEPPPTMARRVAGRFAAGGGLDDLVSPTEQFSTEAVERELKGWLATELRRVAKVRGVKVDAICDRSGRRLQDWVGGKREP